MHILVFSSVPQVSEVLLLFLYNYQAKSPQLISSQVY